ncbi:DUF2252 domain-containing protein [Novosphingobium sp. JCM 18896]|uniref:DUF2252 domain-containing protein n=1 Tax=Novosphingobium sp. JCM 18896 TaxID=2989731 RepID=UPI002223E34C|nr:DUF2252 domain-containing protein [Novosphingobium sp. JCM 18896]MCW1430265.1 DUF2252 domain-containing protein [Novosphingobium sp. JCM 18896]
MPQILEDRATVLERIKSLKMARSTHAYVRGNTIKFYEWLASSRSAAELPVGPPVWICGDCHLGNLGPVADAQGQVEVQIRDLDQTVVGNPVHDLIRLGLSLASAARGSDLPGVTTARMIEQMVEGYDHALALGDEDDTPEPNTVRAVRRRALGRRWRHLAAERLTDVEPRLPLGKKFWALEQDEHDELGALFEQDAVQGAILSLNGRETDNRVRLIDAAYWMKGCSSLGSLRFAVLLGIGGSKKVPAQYALIDLKEAVDPAAPAASSAAMPQDNAQRVVAGARALAPNLGERMLAVRLLGKPVVMRELMPQDLKLEIDQFSRSEATKAARYLAYVVGVAHARQMGAAERRTWRRELAARSASEIEAPSWLWNSVVDLTATHEAGYLEHCRRYALATAS